MFDNFLNINDLNLNTLKIDNFYVLDTAEFKSRKIDRISIESRKEIISNIAQKINLTPKIVLTSELSSFHEKSLITNFIRTGEHGDSLKKIIDSLSKHSELYLFHRKVDQLSWNFCKGGFFKLKSKINNVVDTLLQPSLFN